MTDKATGILFFPYWPSQPWFPLVKSHLIGDLLILEPNETYFRHLPEKYIPFTAILPWLQGCCQRGIRETRGPSFRTPDYVKLAVTKYHEAVQLTPETVVEVL